MEKPKREVVCPDCGGSTYLISEDSYYTGPETKVVYEIYHCDSCGHDEAVEEVWQLMAVGQRRHFWG